MVTQAVGAPLSAVAVTGHSHGRTHYVERSGHGQGRSRGIRRWARAQQKKKKMKEPRNLDARDFLSQQFSLYDDASQKFKATFHEYKYTSDLDDVRSIE